MPLRGHPTMIRDIVFPWQEKQMLCDGRVLDYRSRGPSIVMLNILGKARRATALLACYVTIPAHRSLIVPREDVDVVG